jgi:hypothetical protein
MHHAPRTALLVLVIVLLMLGTAAPAQAAAINFDTTPIGTFTPLTIDGVTFTGTPAADWQISAGFFSTLTGLSLVDGPVNGPSALEIRFPSAQSSASLKFAIEQAVPLAARAYLGATQVFAQDFTGVVPPGFSYPEGVVSITGTFDRLVLLAATAFAIDDLNSSDGAVASSAASFNPGDGRINPQAYAPVAIYCEGSEIVVYAISPTTGIGEFAFRAAQAPASALGVTLDTTADGRLAVSAAQRDGKQYTFIFNGCPARASETYLFDPALGTTALIETRTYP